VLLSLLNLILYPRIPPPVTAGQDMSAYALNPKYPLVSMPLVIDTESTFAGPALSTTTGLVGSTCTAEP